MAVGLQTKTDRGVVKVTLTFADGREEVYDHLDARHKTFPNQQMNAARTKVLDTWLAHEIIWNERCVDPAPDPNRVALIDAADIEKLGAQTL